MATEGSTESLPLRPVHTESQRTLRFLVPAVVLLLVAGGWVSWLGTRGEILVVEEPGPEPVRAEGSVLRIEMPHPDLELPPGPHRDRFQVGCTVCHSPRLALTQPGFPEKKWAEVVHKMVAVYGAPLSPDEEREIVAYLTAVRGD